MANHYVSSLLGKNEKIIFTVRQHWLVYAQAILPETLIIILLITGSTLSLITWKSGWIWFSYLILLLPLISILRDTLLWTNKQYMITNHRVIQVSGIINKDVIDSSLEKVNDVKLVQSFWGRLFDFGNIHIMTASELGVNLFSQISKPIKFKTTMLDAKEHEEAEVGEIIAKSMQSVSIPEMIEKLADLKTKGLVTETEFQEKKKILLDKVGG